MRRFAKVFRLIGDEVDELDDLELVLLGSLSEIAVVDFVLNSAGLKSYRCAFSAALQ